MYLQYHDQMMIRWVSWLDAQWPVSSGRTGDGTAIANGRPGRQTAWEIGR